MAMCLERGEKLFPESEKNKYEQKNIWNPRGSVQKCPSKQGQGMQWGSADKSKIRAI